MRRIFIFILSVAASAMAVFSADFQPETLHYKVMFKWGLINKQAGTAMLSLEKNPAGYSAQLTASSDPWADKFYKVRDTLNGSMTARDMLPLIYEKIANEGNERKHDVVKYNYGNLPAVTAACTRVVFKKGELHLQDSRELEAEGEVVDMLSSFYYMRNLPYEQWTPGYKKTLTIFSGKQKEVLTIRYDGRKLLNFEGDNVDTYHITFLFTSKGGTKTSDSMEAWISADSRRIPLRMEGKLPVGKVHCIYLPE